MKKPNCFGRAAIRFVENTGSQQSTRGARIVCVFAVSAMLVQIGLASGPDATGHSSRRRAIKSIVAKDRSRTEVAQMEPRGSTMPPIPGKIAPWPTADSSPEPWDALNIRPLASITTNIEPPLDNAGQSFLPDASFTEQIFAEQPTIRDVDDSPVGLGLTSPGPLAQFCHLPLYFEEEQLERHGNSFGIIQPVVSGAHFFGSVAALPYKAVVERPRQCLYYNYPYLAGRPAPRYHRPYPLRIDAGLLEAGLIVGLVAILP